MMTTTASPASRRLRSAFGATTLKSTASRWQFWILLLVIGALVAVIMQLVSSRDDQRYGLNNTGLDGYGAVSRVLEDQGITVTQAYTSEDALELSSDHDQATVVVFATGHAPPPSFLDDVPEGQDVVVIAPDGYIPAEVLGDPRVEAGAASTSPGAEAPADSAASPLECTIAPALAAETLGSPGAHFSVDPAAAPASGDSAAGAGLSGCFPATTGDDETQYALLSTEQATLFASPEAFTNRNIEDQGHAALALGLFGANENLIWYTPSGADYLESDEWASPWDFLPAWVGPLGLWLIVCGGLLVLVSGRRHGPVVSEPLPVDVPASEAAEGRGRMYQNANAYRESAWTLRSALLVRMSRLLRMGSQPDQGHIIEAIAREAGRPVAEVERSLDPASVQSNAGLLAFAHSLDEVENRVREHLGLAPRPVSSTAAAAARGPEAARVPLSSEDTASTGGSHP